MNDPYLISVQIDVGYEEAPADRLREAVAQALKQQGAPPDAEVSLVVTGDEAVRGLNRKFLGIDAPTDVLSFPSGEVVPGGEELAAYLGDILIAYPYTSAQAAQEGHTLEHVLLLLAVHGTLHLLGFDHDTPEGRAEMWEAQAAALRELGIPVEVAPSLGEFPLEE